jgi:hypothetical protein
MRIMEIFAHLAPQLPPDFWKLQAKDIITAVIALAAFFTALTSVWVAYLRPRKFDCELGPVIRFGYGPNSDHRLIVRGDVVITNVGARPGILTRMAIRISYGSQNTDLHWSEVLKTENIAGKGEPRKLWTDFAAFASLIPVPRYDSKLVEAGFWSGHPTTLLPNVPYNFQLRYETAGSRKVRHGAMQKFTLSQEACSFLDAHCTGDERGIREKHLELRTTDGRTYLPMVPPLRSAPPKPEMRESENKG